MLKNVPELLLFLLVITTVTVCAPPAKQHKKADTLEVLLNSDPITFNPVLASDAYSSQINSRIYDALLERDPETLDFKGAIARDYKVSEDLLTYTFYLRKNVKFHDGEPLDAADVIFTYNKIMDPEVPNPHLKLYYKDVKSVTAPDRYTVVFTMKKPYFKTLDFLGGFEIIPEHIFSKVDDFMNNEYNLRKPVGSGRYRFVEWKTGQKVILERNEDYHLKVPEIKRIAYRIFKNNAVALQALKKKQLDMMNLNPFQWKRQTTSENFKKNFKKIKYLSRGYRYIGYNTRRELFKDRRVRIAMTFLVNRQKILEGLMEGLGRITSGNFWIGSKQYDQSLKPRPFDPEKARKLLKEAGFTDRDGNGILENAAGTEFSFEMMIPAGVPFYERFTSILREDLKQAGIFMKIRKLEFQVMLDKINSRKFDAVMLAWSTPIESDPYQLWHSSQVKKGHNFTGFTTPEMDSIIENARVEFNEEKRNRMYRRFHAIMYNNQPYTFLFTSYSLVALNRRFSNVEVYKTGLDLNEWQVGPLIDR